MNPKNKLFLILIALFLVSRFASLTIFPVFADEAIYIRWSQFFGREPLRYLLFPLYDGKTPLFMWIVGLFARLPIDPLFLGRAVSVVASLATGITISKLTELVSQRKSSFNQAFLVWTILPFSFIYSRLALIDMLLTLWLALSTFYFFKTMLAKKQSNLALLLPGIFWGLAVITKTSAFYFLPVYAALYAFARMQKQVRFSAKELLFGFSGFLLGSGLLALMALSPLFPFLFQRGADFTFSFQEIFSNPFHIILTNTQRMGKWLVMYCSPLIGLSALLYNTKKPQVRWLLLGLFIWLLPFLLTGKVLSSRYILPSLIFVVPLLVISINKLKPHISRLSYGLLIGYGVYWGCFLMFNPNEAPYPIEDRVQFLTDWSSGHGIKESADYLIKIAKTESVLVATEGFFGTLPDGLMIYLDGKPELDNMRVEGVGLPIFGVPKLLSETPGFDRKFVIVNEHRFVGDPLPPRLVLIQKYPRPHGGPALLLLEYED